MNSNYKQELEHNLSKNVFTQVQCSVHYNKSKLQDQHNEKWNRNLVLLQIRRYSSFTQVRLEINSSFINIIISVD